MAFSIKPRVGLKKEALKEIVLGVLDAGFHIAEFDTRYLDLTDQNVGFLWQLAKEAASVGGKDRITRLSPNLSVSSPIAIETYRRFVDSSDWPRVVKIDGGFDGLSTIQSIRRAFTDLNSPIITCYPLLSDQLHSKIPRDLFIQSLALSGADIIYPGSSPRVGGGTRDLGAAERTAVIDPTKRYLRFAEAGWPMVSLAGGVYLGQLHCLYELVGPSVSFFLGGCVSLHKAGPVEGARLCMRVIKEAVNLHRKEPKEIKDLPGGLVEEVEAAYEKPPGANENIFRYVSPKTFLEQVKVPRW